MRVTSKMMTTNALMNINRNKNNMSIRANQYSTQQKIQRPSEDPVVAVRSLKYRTSISELTQYKEKNVPDALSWMDNTETELKTINSVLTNMNTYFNQGASDQLETSERDALVQTLKQYKNQIYQCLNADNAGRYLFTGFRTDSPLVFGEETKSLTYSITENIKPEDLKISSHVLSQLEYDATHDADDYTSQAATSIKRYGFSVAYDDISNLDSIDFNYKDDTGAEHAVSMTIHEISAADKAAFDTINADTTGTSAYVIKETGEVILPKASYDNMKNATGNIEVKYRKNEFDEGDIRPEHYFECTCTDGAGGVKDYQKPEQQQIKYEVNFNQDITVNTLAKDAVNFDIINQIDDIVSQIEKVQQVEQKLSDVETMIKNGTYPMDRKEAVLELKSQLENEIALQKGVLQEKFGNGITTTTKTQASVNNAMADLGSRYKRLKLTESRLGDQLTSYNEMLTKNDTVDIEDAIVNFTSAMTAYNASLSATSKIAQNSLLDFLS